MGTWGSSTGANGWAMKAHMSRGRFLRRMCLSDGATNLSTGFSKSRGSTGALANLKKSQIDPALFYFSANTGELRYGGIRLTPFLSVPTKAFLLALANAHASEGCLPVSPKARVDEERPNSARAISARKELGRQIGYAAATQLVPAERRAGYHLNPRAKIIIETILAPKPTDLKRMEAARANRTGLAARQRQKLHDEQD